MPEYYYQHPDTKEIFIDRRSFSKADDPYISPDGKKCSKIPWYLVEQAVKETSMKKWGKGLVDRKVEVWEADPAYVRKMNPKKVKTRSGKSIPYNPNTMC